VNTRLWRGCGGLRTSETPRFDPQGGEGGGRHGSAGCARSAAPSGRVSEPLLHIAPGLAPTVSSLCGSCSIDERAAGQRLQSVDRVSTLDNLALSLPPHDSPTVRPLSRRDVGGVPLPDPSCQTEPVTDPPPCLALPAATLRFRVGPKLQSSTGIAVSGRFSRRRPLLDRGSRAGLIL
jgi:hypothetical protein